jgi:hypothetical protein
VTIRHAIEQLTKAHPTSVALTLRSAPAIELPSIERSIDGYRVP